MKLNKFVFNNKFARGKHAKVITLFVFLVEKSQYFRPKMKSVKGEGYGRASLLKFKKYFKIK